MLACGLSIDDARHVEKRNVCDTNLDPDNGDVVRIVMKNAKQK